MPFQFTDMTESGLQKYIVAYLCGQGYEEIAADSYDAQNGIFSAETAQFIAQTQPTMWAYIQQKGEDKFWRHLDSELGKKGLIQLLRKGIKYNDKTIQLFYPHNPLNPDAQQQHHRNRWAVSQELQYSEKNRNRLDLVLALNGIPLLSAELKNPFTGQTVRDAIRQYQQDRSSQEKLFKTGRCMVHFAADSELVYMCSELKDQKSLFLPFNKGLNDGQAARPCGAGNPINPDGLKTAYLWEDIWSKSSLSNIISFFAQLITDDKDKKKALFPRYHQLISVRKLLAHASLHGLGQRYLIQHSAGSGKSNSISWLVHQLIELQQPNSMQPLFGTVVIVTDRKVLDSQLRANVKQFSQQKDLVAAITGSVGSKTKELQEALAAGKRIIICTVQTFPHLLEAMQGKHFEQKSFAIVIDEAHSSQSGENAGKMNQLLSQSELTADSSPEDQINELINSRKMISNGSYFAFTATPKNKTLETFGQSLHQDQQAPFVAFHLYPMKQAIEEGFILDVLSNYTTYQNYYKLISKTEEDPVFEQKKAQKRIRKYVEQHPFAISSKAKIIISHFREQVAHQIKHQAKAMVVCSSIDNAIAYKDALDREIQTQGLGYKTIVAFSGSRLYQGKECTEADINQFAQYPNDIPKNFSSPDYRFLIVANKYQTGFDQPLLHTMYVDKQLSDVMAVQTLSRLNRAHPDKKDCIVIDFCNTADAIQQAFEPYYTSTILEGETDPNKLNELVDSLENARIFYQNEVEQVFALYSQQQARRQIETQLDIAAKRFEQLNLEAKITTKSAARSFVRTYGYLTKIIDFNNHYYEQLWWYLKLLTPKLHIPAEEDDSAAIISLIDMDSYHPQTNSQAPIQLAEDNNGLQPVPMELNKGQKITDEAPLSQILDEFNQRFGNFGFSEQDKVKKVLTQDIPQQLQANEDLRERMQNATSPENAQRALNNALEQEINKLMRSYSELFKLYHKNEQFSKEYQSYIFSLLQQQLQSRILPPNI